MTQRLVKNPMINNVRFSLDFYRKCKGDKSKWLTQVKEWAFKQYSPEVQSQHLDNAWEVLGVTAKQEDALLEEANKKADAETATQATQEPAVVPPPPPPPPPAKDKDKDNGK